MLEAKANTQSLILLFFLLLSLEEDGYAICIGYTKPLLMKTLRENAYAKCDPSSISEPVFQLWEERVSTFRGSDVQPTPLVPVTVRLASGSPPDRLTLAGSATRRCLRCPLHRSHRGSWRLPFPPLPHLHRQRAKY